MNTKKCLSILLSCVLFTEPLISSTQAAQNKDDGVKTSSFAQGVRSKISKVGNYLNEHPKLKKGLKIAGIGAAVCAGIGTLIAAGRKVYLNCTSSSLSPGLPPEFNPEPTEDDIKKQKEIPMGYLVSCLQRTLHKYGIEKTQEEIYEEILSGIRSSHWPNYWLEIGTANKRNMMKKIEKIFLEYGDFDDIIKKYIEKTTNGKYTYQTLHTALIVSGLSFYKDLSKMYYNLCDKLQRRISQKNETDKEKVVLLTLCPILKDGRMVTIEGIRDNKFFIGDPWTGTTVTLNNGSFIVPGSFIDLKCVLSISGSLPMSFIIKKGQEITYDEWNRLIDENFNSKS